MLMEGHSKDLGQFPIKVLNRKGDILVNYMEPVSCDTTVHDFKLKFIKDTNSKLGPERIMFVVNDPKKGM